MQNILMQIKVPSMFIRLPHFFCVSILIFAVSCTRSPSQKDSQFSITLPPDPNVSVQSVSATAVQPSRFCYIVQIRGDGLATNEKDCYPRAGVTTEPSPPLSTIQMEVARGTGRTVELFGYILRESETCQSAPRAWHSLPLNRLFLMGKVENVDTNRDEVTVNLAIGFPGLQNHIGISQQVDPSCYASLPPIEIGEDPNTPTPVMSGSTYSLRAQSQSIGTANILKGSHYQIRQGAIDVAR